MYGVILIATIAIMGGAIAYIGDKLGTKVGKKKLTIFGLRPKHTSIVVTIITGILISASTLGILSLVSQDVRTALFGMEAIKAELASLSQEVSAKTTELDVSRKELEAKTLEYSTLDAKVKETTQKLSALSQELKAVMVERDRTAAELQQVQASYTLARGDLEKSQQEITELQATKNQLDSRITQLNEAKTTLQGDVDRLSQLAESLKKGLQFVREGSMVFRAGEVLYTSTLPGGGNATNTEQALTGMAYKANQNIIDRLGITDQSLEVLWISKADMEQAVAIISANPDSDVIVRLTSAGNTIYGEPVVGQIELYPNHLLYSKGSIVRTEIIDSSRASHDAEEAVLGFLQNVNISATKKGILPDPIQGTVGTMSGSQLYETVNKVKRYNGKVEITAVAKADVYTVGPLKIDIEVKPVQ